VIVYSKSFYDDSPFVLLPDSLASRYSSSSELLNGFYWLKTLANRRPRLDLINVAALR